MKNKKAIKELKATTDQLCKMYQDMYADIQSQIEILFNERLAVRASIERLNSLVNAKNGKIDALSNKLGNLKSDVQTIAKHVQNLEEKVDVLESASKTLLLKSLDQHEATVLIAKHLFGDHFTLQYTNTQKTDKNATEWQQEGKNKYSETIVTNEMFNEELEKRFAESFIQDHPAFLLLNKDLDSGIIESLIRSKLQSKGNHYSPNGDRYSNFKRLNGYANKKTVKERIENFMEKHEIWIEDYQAGDVNGTLLDLIESCVDVLCYYLLLDVYLKFNPESKNG